MMGRYFRIKGYSLIFWICAPLHFFIAFWFVVVVVISFALDLNCTCCILTWDRMWVAWERLDWGNSHLLLIITGTFPSYHSGFPETREVPFIPRKMTVQVPWLGDIQGPCARVNNVPKLSKLPFALSPLLPLPSLYQLPYYMFMPSCFEKLPLMYCPLIISKFLSP